MILDLFKLDGQVALVTDGGSGLGQGMAIALAEAGADVAVVYSSQLDLTRQAIAALGRRCMGVQLDLGKASVPQLQGAVQQVVNQFSHLDILVNCAEADRRTLALQYTERDWDEVLRVNLKAAFFLAQAAGAHFRERGRGKVINVGSLSRLQGGAPDVAYTSSKSGLLGLTELLASEWAPMGVNVNCVVRGYLDTALPTAATEIRELREAILERIPARRLGTPQDLHGAVVYLASRASDYVNGIALVVDGGWLVQ